LLTIALAIIVTRAAELIELSALSAKLLFLSTKTLLLLVRSAILRVALCSD
jgi:hypothetical protein